MIRPFTQDDCLLYIYQEMKPTDKARYEKELCLNQTLKKWHYDLLSSINQLPTGFKSLSEGAIQRILSACMEQELV